MARTGWCAERFDHDNRGRGGDRLMSARSRTRMSCAPVGPMPGISVRRCTEVSVRGWLSVRTAVPSSCPGALVGDGVTQLVDADGLGCCTPRDPAGEESILGRARLDGDGSPWWSSNRPFNDSMRQRVGLHPAAGQDRPAGAGRVHRRSNVRACQHRQGSRVRRGGHRRHLISESSRSFSSRLPVA